ncbi:shikimate O-hydroxycinnamoyltransferase [Vigna unguiculata]|uniref:Shikimate O-hydroxycinnamoyltransferase n=1 Tax=Vigna unguiculata TaxID=3917 RepID=A0A4D6L492_VIGUN|nr:shikimate O-hydroxycinnamoyltransferase [Vigna unguiculata]
MVWEESIVHDVRLSSVGPGQMSGSDVFHHPGGLDLAMKLHYLRVVYLFDSEASKDVTIMKIKDAMFSWFNHYFITCGRFRRSECGRPFIKCNDCGARFIEGNCSKTLEEWLAIKDCSLYKFLVSHQVIGPELSFSPPVLFQVTRFKCGGISLGLSWAHILGDPLSASEFINSLGRVMNDLGLKLHSNIPRCVPAPGQPGPQKDPISAKRIDPVGDHWIPANNKKMDTFSFHITSTQLNYLQAQIWGPSLHQTPGFESVCAMIWHCVARVRTKSEPKTVTVCRTDPYRKDNDNIGNNQVICKVEAGSECCIVESDLSVLARMLEDEGVDERKEIEEAIERDEGVSDLFVYGANLTFVDLEKINLYDLQLKGQTPRFVYYTIQGVGDEGAILVYPGPHDGKFVTMILPEDEMPKLKSELKINGLLLEDN